MRIAVVVVLVACRKEEPPARRYAPIDPVPIAADAAPAPVDAVAIDAGPAPIVTAEWPTAMEWYMVHPGDQPDRVTRTIWYPKFRVKPEALADGMNAAFVPYVDVKFPAGVSGAYDFKCDPITISRIAVIVRCGRLTEYWTDEQLAHGTGGGSGGPEPIQLGWWMQPGLPPVTIDQLAPNIDVAKLIATASAISTDHCAMSLCELKPTSFAIDTDGITLLPSTRCSSDCEGLFPKIPLAQLAPTHPWGKKLVAWVRQRADSAESLVKYQLDN